MKADQFRRAVVDKQPRAMPTRKCERVRNRPANVPLGTPEAVRTCAAQASAFAGQRGRLGSRSRLWAISTLSSPTALKNAARPGVAEVRRDHVASVELDEEEASDPAAGSVLLSTRASAPTCASRSQSRAERPSRSWSPNSPPARLSTPSIGRSSASISPEYRVLTNAGLATSHVVARSGDPQFASAGPHPCRGSDQLCADSRAAPTSDLPR